MSVSYQCRVHVVVHAGTITGSQLWLLWGWRSCVPKRTISSTSSPELIILKTWSVTFLFICFAKIYSWYATLASLRCRATLLPQPSSIKIVDRGHRTQLGCSTSSCVTSFFFSFFLFFSAWVIDLLHKHVISFQFLSEDSKQKGIKQKEPNQKTDRRLLYPHALPSMLWEKGG